MSWKSFTALLGKSKIWKMSSKSVIVLLGKKHKTKKCPQKTLRLFWDKSEKLKNILKKRNVEAVVLGLTIIQTSKDFE